jgi:hypothetical protein
MNERESDRKRTRMRVYIFFYYVLIYMRIKTKMLRGNMVNKGDTIIPAEHCAYAFMVGIQVVQVV